MRLVSVEIAQNRKHAIPCSSLPALAETTLPSSRSISFSPLRHQIEMGVFVSFSGLPEREKRKKKKTTDSIEKEDRRQSYAEHSSN